MGFHRKLRRVAAIKVPHALPVFQKPTERFLREQRILAQLSHPLIARIYECGASENGSGESGASHEETPWFAMEFVEGQTITSWCDANAVSLRERLEMFRGVCEAVMYAHQHDVIHRDLKPSNIFVTKDSIVKLLDFGIARQISEIADMSGLTQEGTPPLTLDYAAPEQILRNQTGKQTDVYALGIVLYELLTGDVPFRLSGMNISQLTEFLASAQARIPSKAAARLGGESRKARLRASEWADVDTLVMTAIHRDTSKRYQSVAKLLHDVDHFLRQEPLEARPDAISYTIRKFVERNRRVVVLSSMAFAIALGIGVTAFVRVTRSEAEARAAAARATRIQAFMRGLFEGGDPSYGPSAKLTVGELLDRAVKQIHGLDKDPSAQSDLYEVVGTIFHQFGDYSREEPLLQKALALRRQQFGNQSPEVAEVLVDLAVLRADQGRNSDAERLVREGLEISQKTLQPGNPQIGHYRLATAYVLVSELRWHDAKQMLERLERDPSIQPDDLADTLNLLATADISLRNEDEAERLSRRAIDIAVRSKGDSYPGLSSDLANLAMVQYRRKEYRESEANYRKAIAVAKAWYPKNHPEPADLERLLAQVLVKEGKLPEAYGLARSSFAVMNGFYGPDHERTVFALMALASVEEKTGRLDEAIRHLQDAVTILRRVPQGDSIAVALSNLGNDFLIRKEYGAAERSFREAGQKFDHPPSAGALALARVNRGLGVALMRQGKLQEAEPPLLAAYADMKANMSLSGEEIVQMRRDLAEFYRKTNRPQKAREFDDPQQKP